MAKRKETQSRRSKLSSPDGLDLEDKNIYDLQNDIDMQISNIKTEVIDEDYLDGTETIPKSPIKFCIKVEVEEYDEVCNNIKLEHNSASLTEYGLSEGDITPTENVPEISDAADPNIDDKSKLEYALHLYQGNGTDVCAEADEIAKTSKNIADKILARETRNLCGVLVKPDREITLLQVQMYSIYKKWKTRCHTSKCKEQPLFYKCYKCDKSWWHLGPFVEHAEDHINDVYTIYLEMRKSFCCNIVLADSEYELERHIYTEGDCWRCNKPYSFHEKSETLDLCYKCKGCNLFFYKCNKLSDHEIVCTGIARGEKKFVCKICKYIFKSRSDMDRHLQTTHTVRSDLFEYSAYKKCLVCNRKHGVDNNQRCSKRLCRFACGLCSKRFTSYTLLKYHKSHTRSNVKCKLCKTVLPKQCMEVQHYVTHTDNFKLVSKCSLCAEVFLFWDGYSMTKHRFLWHKNKEIHKAYFELVLIPTKLMGTLIKVNSEPTSCVTEAGSDDGMETRTIVNAYEELPVVYDIKEEVVDNDYGEDSETNGYVNEDSNRTYGELMSDILQDPDKDDGVMTTEIKTELMDSGDEDLMNGAKSTDESEEPPRFIIDIQGPPDDGEVDNRNDGGIKKRIPKIYTCCRCGYQGIHRYYKEHLLMMTCVKTEKKRPKRRGLESKSYKPHKCSICKVTFLSLNGYLGHLTKTHGHKAHSCPVCCEDFSSNDSTTLESHVTLHVKQSFLKIKIIDIANASSSTLESIYQCKSCRETVETDDFFAHWESHLNTKRLEDLAADDRERHVADVPTAKQPIDVDDLITKLLTVRSRYTHRTCTICDRHFQRINDSKRHIIEHLLADAYSNKGRYGCMRCQICKEMYSKADSYKKHMREHASLPIYKCGLCNKSFSDSSNFVKHKKVHNIKVLVCDICNNKYQVKSSLEKHMQIHIATKPITCKLCSKVFHIESAYKKHYRTTHDKYRAKFKCLICNIKFRSLKEKWDHMWLVHNERKMKADCPICEQSFRKYQDVRKHIRTDHETVELKSVKIKYKDNEDIGKCLKNNRNLRFGAKEETLIVYD